MSEIVGIGQYPVRRRAMTVDRGVPSGTKQQMDMIRKKGPRIAGGMGLRENLDHTRSMKSLLSDSSEKTEVLSIPRTIT